MVLKFAEQKADVLSGGTKGRGSHLWADTFTVDVQENLHFLFRRSEPFSVPLVTEEVVSISTRTIHLQHADVHRPVIVALSTRSIGHEYSLGHNPPYVLLRAVYVQKRRASVRGDTGDARAPYLPYVRSTCEYGFLTIYLTLVRPVLEYGHVLLVGCSKEQELAIERVQRRALRIISLGGRRSVPDLPTLKSRREDAAVHLLQRMLQENHPLHDLVPPSRAQDRWHVGTRTRDLLVPSRALGRYATRFCDYATQPHGCATRPNGYATPQQ
ncbi:hypothetical protein Bbelb_064650 [Branchiostoma belcheri]|nr:hypothetical protein Bbelb_064650 [Branchiostoma belcheri]